MRVLNVMLSGGRGGIQTAFVHYNALLRHLGHDVINCVNPDAGIVLPEGANSLALPSAFERDPIAIYRAARVLREHEPDAIVAHGKRALMIFGQARHWSVATMPLVMVLHRHRFKKVDAADAVICVTKALCGEAARHGIAPHKIVYVPNFLPRLPDMTAPAPRLGPPIIGFLGRLLPEKGPDLLIDALAILKAKGVRFGARIAGDGAIKSEVAARAAASGLVDMVTWLGWVEALPAFFESIDVLCVPSRHESFGLVLLEAFAAGKPVVATRTVGPSETVVEGRNGLLCDIDAVDIAAKLETLLRDPARLTQLGAQARIDAAGYAMPAVAPNVAAVLTGLIRARALAPMA